MQTELVNVKQHIQADAVCDGRRGITFSSVLCLLLDFTGRALLSLLVLTE